MNIIKITIYNINGNIENSLNNKEENKKKKSKNILSKLYKWFIPQFKHFIGMS
jgi:hypothetical protein